MSHPQFIILLCRFLSSIIDKSVKDPDVVNALVAIVMGVWLQFEEKDQLVSPIGQVEVQWMVKLASTTVEICQKGSLMIICHILFLSPSPSQTTYSIV